MRGLATSFSDYVREQKLTKVNEDVRNSLHYIFENPTLGKEGAPIYGLII